MNEAGLQHITGCGRGAVGAHVGGGHAKWEEGLLHWGRSHQVGLPRGGDRQAEGDVQGHFWTKGNARCVWGYGGKSGHGVATDMLERPPGTGSPEP